MGFFKKIFKGVKKVFKKIGRGIKKVVGKVGKFMDKLGWVGNLALNFIIPGGAMALLGNVFKGVGTALKVIKPFAAVMNAAGKFVKVGANVFRTVTEGIGSFLGNMGKAVVSKLPGGTEILKSMNMEAIGFKDAWKNVQTEIGNNYKGILDPFKVAKGQSILGGGRTLESISKSTGLSIEDIAKNNEYLVQGIDHKEWGSVIAGESDRVHTKLFDITLPDTIPKEMQFNIDPKGNLSLPEFPKDGEITIPKTTGIDVTTEGPLYNRDQAFTFPKAGEVTLGDLKAPEVTIDDSGKLKFPTYAQQPSLLDPYGQKVVSAIGQTFGGGPQPQEDEYTPRQQVAFEKPKYIDDREGTSAAASQFSQMAARGVAEGRAYYDNLLRQGNWGNPQSVYDEWSRAFRPPQVTV